VSTSFVGANLRKAAMQNASMVDNLLSGADLTQADLSEAFLFGNLLIRTALGYARFTECIMGECIFADVDLSSAEDLETVLHFSPSTIGIDTLYLSGGNIPDAFLRGAGVPEPMIEYALSLLGRPIDYYSCFISYAGEDKYLCDRLYADLQAEGVRVWYFPESAKWGQRVWGEIDRGIRLYDKLVVICSQHSLQSQAVLKEIDLALSREQREGKDVLFPVRLDNYMFDDWKHAHKQAVLDKVVGDFRGWDFDNARYQTQFERLLGALQQ